MFLIIEIDSTPSKMFKTLKIWNLTTVTYRFTKIRTEFFQNMTIIYIFFKAKKNLTKLNYSNYIKVWGLIKWCITSKFEA